MTIERVYPTEEETAVLDSLYWEFDVARTCPRSKSERHAFMMVVARYSARLRRSIVDGTEMKKTTKPSIWDSI